MSILIITKGFKVQNFQHMGMPDIQIDFENLVVKADNETTVPTDVVLGLDPDGVCRYIILEDNNIEPDVTVAMIKAKGFLNVFSQGASK